MFCVECGKEPEQLYAGLCSECFLDRKVKAEIEEPIPIEICATCGRVREGERWFEKPDLHSVMVERIDEAIDTSDQVDRYEFDSEFTEQDPKNIRARIDLTLFAEDLEKEIELESLVTLKKDQCKTCSRIHGDYYEAVLQVRPSSKELTQEQERRVREAVRVRIEEKRGGERGIFVAFEEEKHGGIDFYLSDQGVTRNLASDISDMYGGKITSSSKLAGREDGENVYRMTYSVRLPPYEAGDFVEMNGEIYRVQNIRGQTGTVVFEDLVTGNIKDKKVTDEDNIEVIGESGSIEEAVIVSRSEGEIQVLDPENYETVTLLKKEEIGEDDESVETIKIRGELYLV